MPEQSSVVLKAQSAFPGLQGSPRPLNAGIAACERDLQLATVIAYKGCHADVAALMKQHYDLSLPEGPRRATSGRSALIGLGPRSWLFQREAGASIAPELSERIGDAAAVTDQSDGYVVLRLSGSRVQDLLAKGISLDFHGDVFIAGTAAVTSCAHMGVILWRLDDAGGLPVFEIAVFRSLARSLWHFIEENAAEFRIGNRLAALIRAEAFYDCPESQRGSAWPFPPDRETLYRHCFSSIVH